MKKLNYTQRTISALLLISILHHSHTIKAEIVTHEFSATVTGNVNGLGQSAFPGLARNDVVTGHFVYDTNTIPAAPPAFTKITGKEIVFHLNIDGIIFNQTDYDIRIDNGSRDEFRLRSSALTSTGHRVSFSIFLIDRTGEILTSGNFPPELPGLSSWTTKSMAISVAAKFPLDDATTINLTFLSFGLPPDVVFPTQPLNLTTTEIKHDQITLQWDASTDNIGVTEYKIFRKSGDSIEEAGTSTSLTFTDTDLTPLTTYEYTVIAIDAAGNESPPSDPLQVTTTRDPAIDPNSSPSIKINSSTLIQRVINPPSHFDINGQLVGDNQPIPDLHPTEESVFHGIFQIEFGLDKDTYANGVMVDVFIKKPNDFDFKKIGEVNAGVKPDDSDPWTLKLFWNSRQPEFDWTTVDAEPFRTTEGVQFKFEVR